jgi:AAA+ superfamily predicted ATPase
MLQEDQDFRGELEALFGANAPLVNLVTYEEDRVIRTILDAAPKLGVYAWDVLGHLEEKRAASNPIDTGKAVDAEKILQFIARDMPEQTVLVLKDFHMAWKNATLIRGLRNLAPKLRAASKFLVMVTPMEDVPVELKDEVYVLHVPLPDETELMRVLDATTSGLDEQRRPNPTIRHLLINSALGLTTNQARMAFSRVWAKQRRFDEQTVQLVTKEKRRIVRESGALEFTPAGADEADVGGLDLMKSWLRLRECVFSKEARRARLPYPKGVALIGIPGTGKSLSARMTASVLKLPLLRMDMGAIFGSLLGESEAHIRKAVNLAEVVSPCILWIDEMEKAFAGAGPTGGGGSGAATRVFGTFLTWMQERTAPVFVFATANDISNLPPELIGRFDRLFFLDVPNAEERREIFIIHLSKAGLMFPERQLDLDELVDKTKGYVGREIERIVIESRFAAFADKSREIEQADVLKAIKETVPLSRSHAHIVEELREWKTEGRAFPASSGEEEAVVAYPERTKARRPMDA